MTLSTLFILAVAISRRQLTICDGFPLTPKNNNINNIRGDGCNGFGNGGGGDNNIPRTQRFYDEDGNGDIIACNLATLLWSTEDLIENDDISNVISEHEVVDVLRETKHIRGGGGVSPKKKKKSIGSSVNDSLDSIQTIMFQPFKSISNKIPENPFGKRDDVEDEQSKIKKQQELTIVTSVSAPSSEVLDPDDITKCAKESKLIGGTLSPETMEVTAKKINDLYLQEGYVMNSVTGAVLVPKDTDDDNVGHVELKVKEVKVAKPSNNAASPLHISFIDKIKEEETSTDASQQSSDIRYKIVSGRTRPSKIARMVNLVPGSNFQIRHDLWSQVSAFPTRTGSSKGRGSAIFSTIHAIQPKPTSDNTAELQIIATENKPYTSLEYGVTKSLYSDEWEGELDLKHNNAFGGGEVATVNIRKGKSSSQSRDGSDSANIWQQSVTSGPLNWRFSIKDDYLSGGSNAGYDLEVFHDHVGVSSGENKAKMPEREAGSNESGTPITSSPLRTGASMRLKLPQINRLSSFLPKAISTRLERVDPFTNDDSAQYIASTSTDIGPYNHKWNILSRPLRSTVSAIGSAGGRWNIDDSKALEVEKDSAKTLQYATGTITSQQVMPLHNNREGVAAIDLTMKNVVSASTRNLPRHEAILLGLSSARIRGYKYNYQQPSNIDQSAEKEKKEEPSPLQAIKQFVRGGSENQFRPPIAIKNAISGSMEVRVPFERIVKAPVLSSGTIVVFGDWCVAQALPTSSSKEDTNDWHRHSSMGIGIRKAVQGIPLKIDACITEHGNKGLFFGIGV